MSKFPMKCKCICCTAKNTDCPIRKDVQILKKTCQQEANEDKEKASLLSKFEVQGFTFIRDWVNDLIIYYGVIDVYDIYCLAPKSKNKRFFLLTWLPEEDVEYILRKAKITSKYEGCRKEIASLMNRIQQSIEFFHNRGWSDDEDKRDYLIERLDFFKKKGFKTMTRFQILGLEDTL